MQTNTLSLVLTGHVTKTVGVSKTVNNTHVTSLHYVYMYMIYGCMIFRCQIELTQTVIQWEIENLTPFDRRKLCILHQATDTKNFESSLKCMFLLLRAVGEVERFVYALLLSTA